jgi:hypothetical protein
MAILKPEPNSANSRMALRRFSCISVSTLSRRKVRYAEAAGGAAHPAPYLVQLGKAHPVRVLDDQGVDVGDVDAGLDDGGAHQNLGASVGDGLHDGGDAFLVHLAVGHADAHVLAQKLVELFGGLFDVVDAVVEVVHLSAPLELPAYGV